MEDIRHYDILWVDDFDKGEKVDDPRKYLRDYFPDRFSFRVKIEQSFFNALVHLENNFTNYSCVVLDVNFIKGFNFDELNEDDFSYEISDGLKNKKIRFEDGEIEEFESLEDDEKDDIKEAIKKAAAIQRLYGILKNNNILLDDTLDARNFFDDDVIDYEKISAMIKAFNENDDFKKNAGYYLFLYLLQRGMPSKNIAMLTGNAGKGQTSEVWEEKFKKASLQSPKAFDRKQCELTKKVQTSAFVDWLNNVFNPPYRFRACMIAMTALLQKMLDDENIKRKLLTSNSIWTEKDGDGDYRSAAIRNFHPEYIPFRLPEDEEKSAEILFHFISQVVIPWDKSLVHKCSNNNYPYYATMKTTRNWLAHRVIKSIALQTQCFLFGVCMRGLFNFSNVAPKILGNYTECWEDELLKLMTKLDSNYSSCVDGVSTLVVSSSEEIFTRSNCGKESIHNVLRDMGQPNSIKCYENDLLRAFLHGVYGFIPYDDIREEDIRVKYLKAIKNKLKKAIDEAKKSDCRD